jgi:DnaJ-class molecular chaperone
VNDPYKTLGVARAADQAAIKAAYRKLAKKYHPDLNPGDADVERRFKEISAAYDVLGDPTKRSRYDRGEIGPEGRERPAGGGSGFWRTWSRRSGADAGATAGDGPRQRFDFNTDFEGDDDPIDEILKAWRGSKAGTRPADSPESGARTSQRRSPQDQRYRLKVPFVEAVLGIKKHVTLSDGKVINLSIPPATEDGAVLRLKGQGKPAAAGKPAGDAYLELQVEPHAFYRREGRDIHLVLPVTLPEAVLGGSVTVPTVHGAVNLKIPKSANSGQVLRLRGKGVPTTGTEPAGDQYVTLSVMLPADPDPALEELIEEWKAPAGYNPRHKMGL